MAHEIGAAWESDKSAVELICEQRRQQEEEAMSETVNRLTEEERRLREQRVQELMPELDRMETRIAAEKSDKTLARPIAKRD